MFMKYDHFLAKLMRQVNETRIKFIIFKGTIYDICIIKLTLTWPVPSFWVLNLEPQIINRKLTDKQIRARRVN